VELGWVQHKLSLENYAEFSDARLRFRFISDAAETGIGWFIDDIKIEDGPMSVRTRECRTDMHC